MTRARLVTLAALAVMACQAAGLVWAAIQIRSLTTEQQRLHDRLARAEPVLSGSRISETNASAMQLPPSNDVDLAALALEVESNKKQLQDLLSALEITASVATGDDKGSAGGPKAVLAVHDGNGTTPAALAVGQNGSASSADAKSLSDLLSGVTAEDQEKFKAAVLKVIDDQKQQELQRQALAARQRMVGVLAKSVGLNPYQLDRVNQIVSQGAAQEAALRRQMSDANRGQINQQIQQVMGGMDGNVRSVLTVEQINKYNAWRNTPIARGFFGAPHK